jgi:hypothetical protein|tara:strand:+ start:811 stop:2031 length:1221 start_codon:yes stop_codon:yes gene_type:complete
MALEYYASIDLNKNELQNAVVHPLGSAPLTPAEGQIYYDSSVGDKKMYLYNGSAWVAIGETQSFLAGEGIDVNTVGENITISGEDATTTNKGIASFATADFSVSVGAVSIKTGGVSNDQLAGSIANSKLANSSITIGDSSIALGSTDTTLTGLTSINLTAGNKTIFDGVGANNLTIGAASTTLIIPGDLQILGTTTTSHVETVSTSNGVVFEGDTVDDSELILKAGTLNGDQTVTLTDLSGYVAIFSVEPTVTITSTPQELNLLDGLTTLSGSNTGDEPDASATVKGVIEIATSAETQAGTDTARAITADGLAAKSVTAQIDVSQSNFISNKYAEITHSLGTEDVLVQLFDATTKQTVYADVARTDKADSASTSKIKISFGIVPSNDVDVIITSVKGASAGSVAYA